MTPLYLHMYSNQFAVSPCEHAMPFVKVGVLSGSSIDAQSLEPVKEQMGLRGIEMTEASQSKRFTFKHSLHSDPLHKLKLKLIKASKYLKHKQHNKSSTYL